MRGAAAAGAHFTARPVHGEDTLDSLLGFGGRPHSERHHHGHGHGHGHGHDHHKEEPWGVHHLVLACIGLLGILATAALAAATLGYEVGLNHTEFQVEGRESEGRGRHREAGHDRERPDDYEVVELPGPSVEEFSMDLVDKEDALWKDRQRRWKEEEKEWRAMNAPNQTVFYMYRAQSSKGYPPVNINTADVGGVLWYLHHEVVGMTPRKYHVTRIMRLKVTVKNTEVMHKSLLHFFGPFVAFDSGRCTAPTCDNIWNHWGFVVGCQVIGGLEGRYSRQVPCDSAQCHAGVWYSLPGPCPRLGFKEKSDICITSMPGGACSSSDVTGEADCTYHVEEAGSVGVDEYSMIRNYTGFVEEGRREYDPQTDRGVRYSFWDGIKNQSRCNWRMNRLQLLFKKKFPDLPALLEAPDCPR